MRASTSWVVARLPADCSTKTRSGAGRSDVQLAVRADVVDAGVGAGVGQEQQAGVEAEGEAVGHAVSLAHPAGRAGRSAGPAADAGQDQRAEQAGDRRGDEDADLRLVLQDGVVEGQAGDEQRHGEPDAGQRTDADDGRPRGARRQLADAEAHGEPRERGDADRLADDEPEHDAVGDRRRRRRRQRVRRDRHAGVRQREQRDDDEARPRVQEVLEPLDDGDRLAGDDDGVVGGLDGRHVGQLVGVDQLTAADRAPSAPSGRARRR